MSKYKKTPKPSAETISEAMKIARGIQKPNQTKEQTRLIAQGIQKGLAQYKKQQKARAHELDKLKKKLHLQSSADTAREAPVAELKDCKTPWLPWVLLIFSWLGMAIFVISSSTGN